MNSAYDALVNANRLDRNSGAKAVRLRGALRVVVAAALTRQKRREIALGAYGAVEPGEQATVSQKCV
jgi:hypothetical protein